PGAESSRSSSSRRAASASGSKVITDPGELGPDLLELLGERLVVLRLHAHCGDGTGRARALARCPARAPYAPWHFFNFLPLPPQHGSLRPMFSSSDFLIGCGASPFPTATGTAPAPARAWLITAAPAACSCSYCSRCACSCCWSSAASS